MRFFKRFFGRLKFRKKLEKEWCDFFFEMHFPFVTYPRYETSIHRDFFEVNQNKINNYYAELFKVGRGDHGFSGLVLHEQHPEYAVCVHGLKLSDKYFSDVEKGIKTFEIRFNDRNFKVGDILLLREYDGKEFTGRVIRRKICYIVNDPEYCKEGYVVLGLEEG